jgi:methyl-accepting chemotaxis protein
MGDHDGLARDAIAGQLKSFQTHIWPLLGLLLCVVALHAVAVTHRVAGPLVRIHRCLREVGEGDMSARVRIRRRDYLWLEAQVLNDMLDHLGERVERAERGADRAEALLDSARRSEHGARIIPREILVEQVEALISSVRDIRHRRAAATPGETSESVDLSSTDKLPV